MASPKVSQPASPASLPARSSAAERLIPWLLLALTLATLWPLLLADFAKWDDHVAIVNCVWLNPPTWQKMAYFWNPRHPFMDIWIPLTYTIWSAVAAVSYVDTPDPDTGAHLNPWIFHGTNLLVHAISVLVVYAILKRVAGKSWPAAAGAALFAIHPVQVEPVGWTCGLKDVLAGCLGLVAVWQYLLFASGNGGATGDVGEQPVDRTQTVSEASSAPVSRIVHYSIATAAFILAMLAKPSGIVTPLVVGAIAIFLLRQRIRSAAAALLPWLVLTIPIIVEGHFAQPAPHTVRVALPLRPLIATDSLAFYLYKLLFPIHLGITYERSPQVALAHHWPSYTWIAPAAVIVLLCFFRKRWPWLLAAAGIFVLALLPVLGLVPFDFQKFATVADHYLYLAMLGPALALAMALRNARGRLWITATATVLALFAARAFLQTWTWQNTLTLLGNAVAVNPHGTVTYYNLAEAYRDRHNLPGALSVFEESLRHNPDSVMLRLAYADTLEAVDRPEEARRQIDLAAKNATADDVWVIQKSLQDFEQRQTTATQKSASGTHLTPATSPIK